MGNACEPQRAETMEGLACAQCCGPILDAPAMEQELEACRPRPPSACTRTDEAIPLLLRHSPAGKLHTHARPQAWNEQVEAVLLLDEGCRPASPAQPPLMARLTGTPCTPIGRNAARHGLSALHAAQLARRAALVCITTRREPPARDERNAGRERRARERRAGASIR